MSTRSMLVQCDPASASGVRHQLSDDLRARRVSEASVDDALLVAGELLCNAIRHAGNGEGDGIAVTWDIGRDARGDHVTVHVHDHSDEQPMPRDAAPDAAHGRGLKIVAAIADEWGVRPATRGKMVWARVPIKRVESDRQTA